MHHTCQLERKKEREKERKKERKKERERERERERASGGWWHTPLIPALGRQRQVNF
jgi:hypothetical protein